MRLMFRATAALLGLGGVVLAAWLYVNRDPLTRQWMCYRAGAAASFQDARESLRWFEAGPDREARLSELVGKWGTGNPRFDLFLARYVAQPESSEALRERFSLEFGWRDELLERWAHYWAWQAPQAPEDEIASIVAYLDTLASASPPRQITWREVLDLQAIFHWTGHTDRARRLKPSNWHARYTPWRDEQPTRPKPVTRPDWPFADWRGPLAQGCGPQETQAGRNRRP
ncbi:MAG: hypothetical protein HUU20_23245 [Pirellulales bacterium]|nr:hypothetical protein [Pirellulales bacterium]